MANTNNFYMDSEGRSTDLKTIKQIAQTLELKLEMESSATPIKVPANKFNIVIMGANTNNSAVQLLSLDPLRSTTLLAQSEDLLSNQQANLHAFKIYEQDENPKACALEHTNVYEEHKFLDLNDLKNRDLAALQSCLKIVECPSETATTIV